MANMGRMVRIVLRGEQGRNGLREGMCWNIFGGCACVRQYLWVRKKRCWWWTNQWVVWKEGKGRWGREYTINVTCMIAGNVQRWRRAKGNFFARRFVRWASDWVIENWGFWREHFPSNHAKERKLWIMIVHFGKCTPLTLRFQPFSTTNITSSCPATKILLTSFDKRKRNVQKNVKMNAKSNANEIPGFE